MQLTVEEHVFILESYLKTMSYVRRRQSFFFEKFRRQAPVKSAIAKMIKKFRETGIHHLGRSGQRPELSQATGMALVRCILGKFLGAVCH